ncbi:MAG: ATP-dependent zinc metalloprotease FtsH [Patescibacteria group bacterium]
MKPLSKNIILFVVFLLVIAAAFSTYSINTQKPEKIGISKLVEYVQQENIKNIEIRGDEIKVILNDDAIAVTQKEKDESLSDLLTNYGVTPEQLKQVNISVKEKGASDYFMSIILPSLLPLIILIGIFWFMIRQMQGANNKALSFGQSGAREANSKKKQEITFKDVAGAKEAKEELQEVVDFLKNPKKFAQVGAKLPRGALLMGRPGTGKTLMARAVAGEAGVPFFHISGSEFVEMFVGVGASRVRDLFAKAKKTAPCIIFIDEIDAVGRQRGAGLGGSHDEREQTLNQILVEMDGFDPNIGVIVVAATNRPDVLDPALLRPGRFDRRIIIDMPDIKEREEILSIHAKNKPIEQQVSMHKIAKRTPGFSGADLMNLLNEAAIRIARRNKTAIAEIDILESIEKVLLGPERRSRVMTDEEKKMTAYHEAGHALVAYTLPNSDPVHKISIISRGHAGGYTLKLPDSDKRYRTRAEFVDELAVMLGGYVTEKDVFNDVSTGPSDDLKRCTQLAREIVTKYGMTDELGPQVFGESEDLIFLAKEIHEHKNYSEKTAQKIDEEISKLIIGAMGTARGIIKDEREMLDKIVKELLEKETLEREDFEALFKTVSENTQKPNLEK